VKNTSFWIFVVVATALTYVGCLVAVYDATPSTHSLQALTPAVQWTSALGRIFNENGYPVFAYGALGVCLILALMGLQTRSTAQNLIFGAAIFAVCGQISLIDRTLVANAAALIGYPLEHVAQIPVHIVLGLGCYLISAILFFIGSRKTDFPNLLDLAARTPRAFSRFDFALLLVVFCIAIVIRMYALNHLLNYFEGEISPYSAGGTSLVGMLYAHEGWWGPWAPLGYLYYLPIYLTTSLFGTSLVALRLSSAIIGLMTIPLVYALAVRLAGKVAGHVAAIVFSLNFLHIGWHRSDIYPHGATTWPSIVMCWCLIKASETRQLRWAAAVAFMMGLSWHQYPSGQSAVVIPLVAIALSWIFNRSTQLYSKMQALVTGSGVLLWAAGLPLTFYVVTQRWKFVNPFDLTGNRTIWGEAGESISRWRMAWLTIEKSLTHLFYVFEAMFVRARHIFHQEWLSIQPLFHPRTVGWLVLAFAVIGLFTLIRFRKRFEATVMFGWMIAALMPGILSSVPYPKRLSTFFPAIDITAAIGVAVLCHISTLGGRAWRRYLGYIAITAASCVFFVFTMYAWFSGRLFTYGEPVEHAVAAELNKAITPGTLVLSELTRGYEAGKYLYLMLDHLTDPINRPNMWVQCNPYEVQSFLTQPADFEKMLNNRLPYVWTKLRNQLEETVQYKDWSHILFVLQRGETNTYSNAALIEAVKARCSNPVVSDIGPPSHDWNSLILVKCPYSDFAGR
jgi:hypothetical protein